jgi:hypothetical protein
MNENNAAHILHKALTFSRLVVFTALILITGTSNLGATTVGPATTVSLVAVANTTIFSAYAENNFGTSLIETGANGVGDPGRGLIQWDLSSIPANATITDAQITMQVVKVPPGDQHAGASDSDFGLYAMLVPWVAGTGSTNSGTLAKLGETTWNERLAGIASWQTPGGGMGFDFASTPSTSAFIGTSLGLVTWGATPQMLSDLQSWLTNPSTNYGYMMMSDAEDTAGTARRFDSIQSAGPDDLPPTLTVTYTVPAIPEPGSGLLLTVTTFVTVTTYRRRKCR